MKQLLLAGKDAANAIRLEFGIRSCHRLQAKGRGRRMGRVTVEGRGILSWENYSVPPWGTRDTQSLRRF
jgi:hypothetical protein